MSLKLTISKRKARCWQLMIVEEPATIEELHNSLRLDECIDWTTQQLNNQIMAIRTSYDTWYFMRKQDAEKFATLWHLKWA